MGDALFEGVVECLGQWNRDLEEIREVETIGTTRLLGNSRRTNSHKDRSQGPLITKLVDSATTFGGLDRRPRNCLRQY